ncbi:GNAT family N-acetyltransferase [Rossellomorea aquimaris]|uniref:GNAT family N-acetyltransferase n=1 Tax=Rossellomorea aquimaris TaxID=189382 RepID=UPI001CD60817|nr:GNAT family N-acetyltransferase [Rossellomorea aquimaris]MCA1055981.1 GNAT family N-acetyltransferase [Rossellomorea aquimaris]
MTMSATSLQLGKAESEQLDEITAVYLRSKKDLDDNGLLQWDEKYPSRDYFRQQIQYGDLYCLISDGKILGSVTLNTWQSPEWGAIPWQYDEELVVHALFLDPLQQGKGLGTRFLEKCEEHASDSGYRSIRLDAYARNEAANSLYEKMGYMYRGSVHFTSKPEGHQEYRCYEKALT